MTNPLRELHRFGQSPWYDSLRRGILVDGTLARYIEEDGLTGLTTNPAIYEKALGGSGDDYEAALAGLLPRPDLDAKGIYEALAIQDIRAAADLLRPVYDRTARRDGYVSLEVSPVVAHDAAATLDEARRLWRELGRENVFIKVPATPEATPAIRQLLVEGINVNVTLLFSRAAYGLVAEAYVSALEERVARGQDITGLASVASFFVSRVDSLVDRKLDEVGRGASPDVKARAQALLGRVAIANAKLAYQDWKVRTAEPRWARLAAKGARPQRLLWASTSTKNPHYRDVVYVEELIGAETVDTMPPATFEAFRDHGRVGATLEAHVEGARAALAELAALGISLDQVTDELVVEGIRLFAEPFGKLIDTIEKRRAAAASSAGVGTNAPA
jgi:transaldolase